MQLTVLLSLLFLLSTTTTFTYGHNITKILGQHPSLSTFNHYLTLTHLAGEINRRTTITVCAVDNAAMSEMLSKNPSITTIKNILSLHVLLDYFGAKKLHQIRDGSALSATMFQATGSAPGSTGFVNITDVKGGKVAFGPKDNGGNLDVFYVKSVEEIPYNISVIQISKLFPSDVAAAPTPAPSAMNLTDIMSAHGCKVFADTLIANPDASKTYQDNIDGGLTVFCPLDDPFKAFLPKFKNLTASGKESFLEFYVQNDAEDVTLKTRSTTAKIVGTLIDEQPLAIYSIDKVLLPKELFKAAPTPAPAPAPEEAADAPKSSKHKKPAADAAPSDSPADSPEGDAADQTADNNASVRLDGGRLVAIVLSLCLGLLLL
ncbi:FASCICLIN-LIKE ARABINOGALACTAN PROTEIN [Salix koriyanagi]|uniref:FASCICLIN-LIKE ARABINOGALACTAN PROTEIN n=1 Tax=Salix koriyanagi TaxID=2511006 RepID=A0A9Q1ALN5_9ROSI|nr:FASCICLIN-LIKE ARABINOGALACTAN PROTEIN [Salix koriyanagi]